jgi:hypothetical protein
MGTISTLSPALILNEGMVGDKLAEFFTKIDLISIWYYFAVAVGLSKAAKISSGKSYGIVYGVWVFWIVITSAFSFIF